MKNTHLGGQDRMKSSTIGAVLAASLAMGVAPAMAHHSFAAEFDANKQVNLEGTLTKLEWTNPHIWVYLDVKDQNGNTVKWQCEGGPPNTPTRNGWTQGSIKPGDHLVVEGWLAKDGSSTCNARSLKLPDGRSVFAGSANNSYK
jgi:Family of unknown function (DUF6152)